MFDSEPFSRSFPRRDILFLFVGKRIQDKTYKFQILSQFHLGVLGQILLLGMDIITIMVMVMILAIFHMVI